MSYTTLIDTHTLAEHLENRDWAIIDCRASLQDPSWGAREYAAAHVPGAVFASLDKDLSARKTGTNGRHPLPTPDQASATFARFGIGSGTQVIAYDQDTGMFASRLWWMLRWLGHDQVAVLDGGFRKWAAEHRPCAGGTESRPARPFAATLRPEMVVSAEDVLKGLGGSDQLLIDGRAPERYRGEVEPIDRVAGHIPGARNFFHIGNVTEEGTFLTPDEIARRWKAEVGAAGAARVVSYCGSGVTGCHNLLALEHAGLRGGRLYPGSWSEWSSDPDRPVEKNKK